MLNGLQWIVRGALLLLGAVTLLWAVSRWMPLPVAQQQALALMDQPAHFDGDNAFDALWLLDFDDVPDAARSGLIAEDGRRIAEIANTPLGSAEDDATVMAPVLRSALGRYPQVASMDVVCNWSEGDCLERVRQAPAALETALQSQQALLARIAALSAYDHYQNPFVADGRAPLPALGLLQRSTTAHALAHVQGNSASALAGICNDTRTARMLMSRSDALVTTVFGAAMVRGNVLLLAEILAELPVDQPLPAACEGVFTTPAPEQLSMCTAMRGEFRMVSRAGPDAGQAMSFLVWDAHKTKAWTAQRLQGACLAESERALANDQALAWQVSPQPLLRLECVANAMGCVISEIAGPSYVGYTWRLQNAGASLRVAEALLWLRAHPQSGADEGLAAMPAAVRGQARPLRVDTQGRQLQVALYGKPGTDDWFSVPLPASRLP